MPGFPKKILRPYGVIVTLIRTFSLTIPAIPKYKKIRPSGPNDKNTVLRKYVGI